MATYFKIWHVLKIHRLTRLHAHPPGRENYCDSAIHNANPNSNLNPKEPTPNLNPKARLGPKLNPKVRFGPNLNPKAIEAFSERCIPSHFLKILLLTIILYKQPLNGAWEC